MSFPFTNIVDNYIQFIIDNGLTDTIDFSNKECRTAVFETEPYRFETIDTFAGKAYQSRRDAPGQFDVTITTEDQQSYWKLLRLFQYLDQANKITFKIQIWHQFSPVNQDFINQVQTLDPCAIEVLPKYRAEVAGQGLQRIVQVPFVIKESAELEVPLVGQGTGNNGSGNTGGTN